MAKGGETALEKGLVNMINSKEMRALAFIGVAMVMAVALCVASITKFNLFSVVVSILMLSTLSVGLGYQYCKHEDTINAALEEKQKERALAKKVKTEKPVVISAEQKKSIKEMLAGEIAEDKVIAKVAVKPNLMSAEKKEGAACANDSAYHKGQ